MTDMLREIHEQPEVLERLIAHGHRDIQALHAAMKERGIEHMSIAARGTSDNGAIFGKYLIEIEGGMVVSLAAPSVFTLYHAKLDLSKWLALGISQSGEAPDVVEVLKHAKSTGALTAGISNVDRSLLIRTVDYPLLCHAGVEKSIAATKSYTATLGVMYLLCSAIAGKPGMVAQLKSAAQSMRSVFEIEGEIARAVERYRYMQECIVIARGFNHATAQEAALKMSETSYMVAKPYSAADFLHGPVAAVDEGFPVFLYAPPGRSLPAMTDLADKLAASGAELVIVSSDDGILGRATTPIRVPVETEELYSPLVYTIVGQLFAHYLAITRGHNPDHPRGLSKITRTL